MQQITKYGAFTLVSTLALACSSSVGSSESLAARASAVEPHPPPKARIVRVDTHGDAFHHRTGHQVTAIGDDLWITRGHEDDIATQHNTFFRDVFRFHPNGGGGDLQERQQKGDAIPPEMAFHCQVATGDSMGHGSLLMFGGAHFLFQLDPGFFQSLVVYDTLWKYRVSNGTWTAIQPSGARPAARAGCNAEEHEGAMYMFGGLNRSLQLNNELWRYDIASETWTQLTPRGPVPQARFIGATAVDHDAAKIYLFNGHKSGPFGFQSIGDFWVYDIASNTFRQLPALPGPSRDEGTLSLLEAPDGRKMLLAIAGHTASAVRCSGFPEKNTALNEVWAFDTALETWQKLDVVGDAPRLEFVRGATTGDKHYLVGGWYDVPDPGLVCRQVWNEDIYEVTLVSP